MQKRSSARGRKSTTPIGVRPVSAETINAVRRDIVPRSFYNREPQIVGQELLGKLLVRREGRKLLVGRIVETEAYLGLDDPAAHAAAGKTARNAVLFGPPGHAYVYFIYGTNYCLNVSCLQEGDAGCVLIRALEPVIGVEQMAQHRGIELGENTSVTKLRSIAGGPGRLAQALGIIRHRDNGKDVTDTVKSDLWIADDGFRPERVVATPRVGITKAVHHDFRYVIAGSPFVSAKRVL